MTDIIQGPVKYNPMGTMIFDSANNHILDIRGWGRFQYMKDGEAIQDSLGYMVESAINEWLKNNKKLQMDATNCSDEKCTFQIDGKCTYGGFCGNPHH